MTPPPGPGVISRADIEAKLREIKSEVDQTTSEATPKLERAAIAGVVLAVGLAFLLGKRKGRKRSTFVEIRRV